MKRFFLTVLLAGALLSPAFAQGPKGSGGYPKNPKFDTVAVGTTCPAGAPAGSICFKSKLYQDGVEFVGGNGSESTPALSEDSTTVTSTKPISVPAITVGAAGTPTVINITSQTIASLPASNNTTGDHRQVSDGQTTADCTTGGGINVHWCYWNGAAWASEVAASLSVAGSSGDLQTNNGSGGLGSVAQSTFGKLIAKGQVALSTDEFTSGACVTTTATATGADPATPNFDRIVTTLVADPSGVTGYGATTGSLTIYFWLSANTVNFRQCNWTSGSITPSALSVNWAVMR